MVTFLALAPIAHADEAIAESDPTASAEASASNQVLEIPQQCDKDAVASLCDRAASDANASSPADPSNATTAESNATPTDPSQAGPPQNSDVGSIDDYQNQNVPMEASGGPVYVAVPEYVYVPSYTYVNPGPVIISNRSMGASPYVQPAPLGFQPGGFRPGGFGGFPHPFGGGVGTEFGGGHFAGRR